MNRTGLIHQVARDNRITKTQTTRVLQSLLGHIVEALKKGDRVTLVGFGTFTVVHRRPRTGRNPQTGVPFSIPRRRVVRFKRGTELESRIR